MGVLEEYEKRQEENEKKMQKWIEKLKEIDTQKLDERGFYEHILSIIKDMEEFDLTFKTAEELKNALKEIGCVRYEEWKKQKELNGEIIEDKSIGEGIESADIGVAVSFISQLMSNWDNADFAFRKMLDGGEKYGWVQQWLRNSQEKSQIKSNIDVGNSSDNVPHSQGKSQFEPNIDISDSSDNISHSQEHSQSKSHIPYYQVAKQALMNWNGLSEEEAEKIISSQSFDEIESQVYAKGSMNYAVEGIKDTFYLSDKDAEEISRFVYEGEKISENNKFNMIAKTLDLDLSKILPDSRFKGSEVERSIIDTLFHVHDGWVKDNVKKFNAREKKHQHMPSELIGWKEVKADLLFVKPIFEGLGVEVDEEKLERVYNDRVKEFFLNRGIKTARDLSSAIAQGKEFYPALEGYGDILTEISNPEYVTEKIIPEIEEQGIGNIEETRRNIVSQIISNPIPEDIERLSDEEQILVEQSLGQKLNEVTAKRDELQQKNPIAKRIMALKHKIRDINREISKLEKEKSGILYGTGDRS